MYEQEAGRSGKQWGSSWRHLKARTRHSFAANAIALSDAPEEIRRIVLFGLRAGWEKFAVVLLVCAHRSGSVHVISV